MKIIYLKTLKKAVFSEEVVETFSGDKLLVSVVDAYGKSITSSVLICGCRFVTGGVRDGILSAVLREGTHPISIEVGGKVYHVGSLTRSNNRVTCRSDNTYTLTVEAAVAAERALSNTNDLEMRVRKLEIASNGVDLLNLH